MSVTEEIKARLDIVAYIGQYLPLKKAGRYYKACCPFHSENTPSFTVNPDTQSWRCFGACAEGGDIFNFAMKQHGWSFGEALEALGSQAGVEVKKQSPLDRQRAERLDSLRGLLQAAADSYHKKLVEAQTDEARAILTYAREQRGFTDDTIRAFGIGYAPDGWQNMLDELTELGYEEEQIIEAGIAIRNENGRVYDRFRNRLMIPIRDERGRVIGFGARALKADDNPKYMNSPQSPVFDKSRVLFGLDAAKSAIRDAETAVIVEGYMDVIQAHQAGFTNVVAQMGTALTETQLKMLVPRYARKIILALDADAAGQNATRRSLETARQTLEADYAGRLSADIRVLQIPGAKDPDDLIRKSPDQWQALVENALPVADYVINMETTGLTPTVTIQERETIARRLLPLLVASENDLYKRDNIQKLAMRLHIAERDLMTWASEQKSQRDHNTPRPSTRTPSYTGAEPPPIDYDSVAPPPDYDDPYAYGQPDGQHSYDAADSTASTATIPQKRTWEQENVSEAHCLRMLLDYPDMFYQINRKFRELAGDNLKLRQGPLSDLGVADFSRGDYRALMQMFMFAVKQQEMEILDFLRENLDPALQQELDRLLVEESAGVQLRLHQRLSADFTTVWKQYERHTRPALKFNEELLEKALQLRLQRFNREINELSFMQTEAQQAGEQPLAEALETQIHLLIHARRLIEPELEKQRSQLT